jgi:diguanylate cyclase (GGDEF)-like protein
VSFNPSLLWRQPYKGLMRFLFGRVTFAEREEDLEFRYKLVIVLMTSGALVTGLFILGTLSAVNPIHASHQKSMIFFTAATTVLWLLLRGHPERFKWVGWIYELVGLWEYTSSLIYVSSDELRLLWFFTNVPGVFILLGRKAGWAITVGTMLGLALGNAHLERPYSPNALATALFCLLYLGIFFHTYVGRTFSYFNRMRDYNARLQDLASHDPLTHLMNARAYYEACEQHIALSGRTQQPYSVLFVDLDHFKKINDTHGHAVGDEVLRAVAQTLGRHLRGSDLLGRIGGEEFSVFLPDTALDGALQVAENLRSAIAQYPHKLGDLSLTITASIGVASRAAGVQNMQHIQQRADAAMYEAKKAGRNRVSTLQMNPSS